MREGGRKGGREGGREGGRKEGREEGREGGRKGGRFNTHKARYQVHVDERSCLDGACECGRMGLSCYGQGQAAMQLSQDCTQCGGVWCKWLGGERPGRRNSYVNQRQKSGLRNGSLLVICSCKIGPGAL